MKPVDQMFLVDRDGRGDCLRACVASILELAPLDVPDFSLFGWNWIQAMVLYADIEVAVPGDVGGYWIAGGMSPRGIQHAVVYLGGEMAHDPHPSRAGLVGNVESALIVKGLKQNVREWLTKMREGRATKEQPQ